MGVYQGTCLGPLLYNIFSNDLGLYIENDAQIIQYADDTQILISGKKDQLPNLITRMESVLGTLFDWFRQNFMKVNASKTQLLVLGTKPMLRNMPRITLNVRGATIEESDTVKNLGLLMDRSLTYEPHINHLSRKCTGFLVGLSHIKHSLPRGLLPRIINALVLSNVRYCISIYGNCSERGMARVQKILNFCARVITGKRRRDHISDVLTNLKWLSARNLGLYHAVCLLRRVVNNREPRCLADKLVTRSTAGTVTRQDRSYALPPIRTESGRRRFCYRIVQYYNRLPPRILNSRIAGFKRRLHAHLRGVQ